MGEGRHGRHIGHGEFACFFRAFPGHQGDIRAGHERAQAGDAALIHTRFHHPKLAVFANHVFRFAGELGGERHAFLAGAQVNGGNAAHVCIQHLNHGVVHFNALGIAHIQRNFRAGVADVVEQQPAAGEEGDERNQPNHKGKTAVAADFCLWFSCGRVFIHCVILRFMEEVFW